jgi:hypothetical protein
MPELLQKLDSPSLEAPDDPSDPLVEFKKSRRLRVLCYKKFLGVPDPRIDADTYVQGAHQGWVSAHDIALGGEICELAGFHSLRDGEDGRARAWLDNAAMCYFLAGLRQGGDRVQWASENLDQIRQYAFEGTLCIPWKGDPWSTRI